MQLKLTASSILLLSMLTACGGSGSGGDGTAPDLDRDSDTGNSNTDSGVDTGNGGTDTAMNGGNTGSGCCLLEDRTAPAPGTVVTSLTAPVVPNALASVSMLARSQSAQTITLVSPALTTVICYC